MVHLTTLLDINHFSVMVTGKQTGKSDKEELLTLPHLEMDTREHSHYFLKELLDAIMIHLIIFIKETLERYLSALIYELSLLRRKAMLYSLEFQPYFRNYDQSMNMEIASYALMK